MKARNINLVGASKAQEKLLADSGLLDMPETLAELEIVISKYQNQKAEESASQARGTRRGK